MNIKKFGIYQLKDTSLKCVSGGAIIDKTLTTEKLTKWSKTDKDSSIDHYYEEMKVLLP